MELKTIQSDNRGSVNLLLGDLSQFQEITVFKTNAGYARGGCQHNIHDEVCCVVEGDILYMIGDDQICLGVGDVVRIPKSTPHYFFSETSSIVLEWGADPEEKKNKHPEFRAIVDNINYIKTSGQNDN